MTRATHQLLLWCILAILTVLGGYAILNSLQSAKQPSNSNHLPDAYMEQVNYQEFNSEGRLHAQLTTPRLTHYPDNDTTLFLKPNMRLITKKNIHWHVTALHGQSDKGSEKVLLWDNVVIHQPKQPDNPETTIKTSQLTVYPDKQTAETKQAVRIMRPGSITTAVGMTANFKTGVFKLLSQSKGHYEPNAE